MFNLILNENMKIYRRVVTWVMIGIVIVINLLAALVLYSVNDSPITGYKDYVDFSANIVSFVVFFTIVIAGGIVSTEFSWGTIKLLLIRPVNRGKILLSKYIATLMFALLLIIVIFLTSVIFGLIFFGLGGHEDVSIGKTWIEYGHSSIGMLMTVTFAFMISVVFRSNALAIALSYIIYFVSHSVITVLSALEQNWGKYILWANTDFKQYASIDDPFGIYGPPFAGMSISFSVIIVLSYFILFNLIAWFTFVKRDVSI